MTRRSHHEKVWRELPSRWEEQVQMPVEERDWPVPGDSGVGVRSGSHDRGEVRSHVLGT